MPRHTKAKRKKHCRKLVSDKISLLTKEGKFKGKQKIAVAFSIITRNNPRCKNILKRKRKPKK